ncbi:glutamate--tRNA ligase [Pedobacter zeae]|uniref:Glutamate--tRNA ligase n=1 Tax=Pedobacter zeae TaxID=1737356 RepID=A0A7W6P6R4_9SPHI|nr:glutamate--tRNA ligase [Pedobacter zeae]MBB4109432.1 glutamyl-tRNA synthetase [Pedobacter zeae]GGH12179.1 glutamate--tRNA ligase [Pedobacter zeae]
MDKKVRVRFAPSPTGGLHLGGVRTALFNYLFAKKNNGTFILRIEDTDQNRFVEGAEQYIVNCLDWCGITPDESPDNPGAYGPYRQSERKPSYSKFAEQLISDGYAYYAFDTPEELEAKRKEIPNFQYGQATRMQMRNSLTLTVSEVEELLAAKTPHVVRIKVPAEEIVHFNDLIRGDVSFETSLVDDKVLLKADGMPTYHLAVVVDDKAMEISHVFRGEEWLPSAPVHILLWKYLGWEANMPAWAHLPLILKPDGHGKLSKRDGDRLGFPVYAMNWTDPKTGDVTKGFKEMGFLPEAFINMLALLGWNDGTDQELFPLKELEEKFTIERISKAGAKFDFEKAKWYNHEWIKSESTGRIAPIVKAELEKAGVSINDDDFLKAVIDLIKDRCTLLPDFVAQSSYFFALPAEYDVNSVKPKWTAEKADFFKDFADHLTLNDAASAETAFKTLAEAKGFKPGELMLPFRIMLVGGKFGPGVFDIAVLLGAAETKARIAKAVTVFNG